jgi:Gram-negative bacterial TonB protein C-terminal
MQASPFIRILALPLLLAVALPLPASAAPEASPIYQYDQVDKKPTPKKRIRMYFPGWSKKKGKVAEITVRFVVTKEGRTTKLTIVQVSDPDLIEYAFKLYDDARFNPGMKDGKPVDTWMEIHETSASK